MSNIFEIAAPWEDLDLVPFHMRGPVKRAQDARRYADITVPKVGDLVTVNYGPHPGKPALITSVSLPTIRFIYPDGVDFSSGIRGVTLVSQK